MPSAVASVAGHFAVEGELASAEPFGRGHINESHLLTCRSGGATARFLLQRLNATVFKNPALVMENVQRVTTHVAAKLRAQGADDVGRRALTLVPTQVGEPFYRDAAGGYWRLYRFIEGTRVQEVAATPEQGRGKDRKRTKCAKKLWPLPGMTIIIWALIAGLNSCHSS